MPSPFPGMDPYLEGAEWQDVHQRLGAQISKQLSPLIRPRYVARLAIATIPDFPYVQEIEVMYPDVEIFRSKPSPSASENLQTGKGGVALLEPPITKPITLQMPTLRVRMVTVEIREIENNRLVTSIEVLSPVNKRKPGLTSFLEKRERLMRAGVHLLDIDLIRRGKRPVKLPNVVDLDSGENAPYTVLLTRAKNDKLELWPIYLQEKLPVVAVPLRAPDDDVPLDLGLALSTIYDEAAYDLTIDYRQLPPPPVFDPETQSWIDNLLKVHRQETVGQ